MEGYKYKDQFYFVWFGYLIGIIWGLYFEKSIAFVLLVIILLYILIIKKLSKFKLIRYLKILLNKKYILLVVMATLISNSYILYINSKYNNFYENIPETIQTEAVVIRRSWGKRVYRYVYN